MKHAAGRTRRLLLAAIGILLLIVLTGIPRPAAAADDAASFLQNLGDRVLTLIRDKQVPDAQRKQQFEQIATQSFDIPKIAQFVLGRYWRTADEAQRQQFIQAFTAYMIRVYWSRFNQYAGESFKVTGQRQETNGATLVSTEIIQSNGKPPAKVDWWVIKSGNGYKITDVSIEGVSQAVTYRQEFASVIERGGGQVSALINQLRQRASS